jgi:hypothetical protein
MKFDLLVMLAVLYFVNNKGLPVFFSENGSQLYL